MNKYIVVILLFVCGCGVFKINSKKSIKTTNTILIHANIESNTLFPSISKIKTKIKISSDTIIASIYPFLGVELGKLTLTKEQAFFQNKYTKQHDSIVFKRPNYINIKGFQKSFIKKKLKEDTIQYRNPYKNCFFTNYIFVEKCGKDSLFLPQKIIIQNIQKETSLEKIDEINIEYKSINLF